MIVLRQVCQIGFQVGRNFGIVFARIANPKLPVHTVTFDKSSLAVQDEAGETTLLVGFDGCNLQQRCLRVIGIMLDERLVGFCCVLVAFFFKIELAKIAIDNVAEVRVATARKEGIDAVRTFHVGKTDTQNTKCIFNQLAI